MLASQDKCSHTALTRVPTALNLHLLGYPAFWDGRDEERLGACDIMEHVDDVALAGTLVANQGEILAELAPRPSGARAWIGQLTRAGAQ